MSDDKVGKFLMKTKAKVPQVFQRIVSFLWLTALLSGLSQQAAMTTNVPS